MIKKVIYNLRRQPVVSAVTVIGTALSIFLIMVFVMMNQIKVAPFAPESNRDRFLHYNIITFSHPYSNGQSNNGPMSLDVVKNLFYPLREAEAVTGYTYTTHVRTIGIPGHKPFAADTRETDANYFNVFDFTFVSGKPYSQADSEAGLPVAVIDANMARRLFGTEDAVGRSFLINDGEYRVSGVVKPVSTLAEHAYGQVWINTTSTDTPDDTWGADGYRLGGYYTVTILAPKDKSLEEVRDDFNRQFADFSKILAESGQSVDNLNRPYTQEKMAAEGYGVREPDLDRYRRTNYTVFAILLIIPAINLAGMTHSRLSRRVSEIAVRRVYGATMLDVFSDIFLESLLVTLLGGLIGLLLSFAAAFLFGNLFFAIPYSDNLGDMNMNAAMLIQWSTLGLALLFCFILNLLSTSLPAIQIARVNLVNSLRGKAGK